MPKKKRGLMMRRHISAPDWLWSRITLLAEADGRIVAELVRRLMLGHLRREDPASRPLLDIRRLGSLQASVAIARSRRKAEAA